jgi:hypothetical protein
MTLSKPLISYDRDFNLWLEQTVNLLKIGRFDELDLDNLVNELESMSRRDKREIQSRLKILLMHLLKWQYQPEQRSLSWRSSIQNNRTEIRLIIEDSPSLKDYPLAVLDRAYIPARRDAAAETELSLELFPVICPFAISEILDEDFFPETKSRS